MIGNIEEERNDFLFIYLSPEIKGRHDRSYLPIISFFGISSASEEYSLEGVI